MRKQNKGDKNVKMMRGAVIWGQYIKYFMDLQIIDLLCLYELFKYLVTDV